MPKEQNSRSIQVSMLIFLYLFINAFFVYKYSFDRLTSPMLIALGYMVIGFIVIAILYWTKDLFASLVSDRLYFAAVIIFAIALYILMRQVNPAEIAVGRMPAIKSWLDNLLGGQFPYLTDYRPSGFPFLFILAMPFYFLGDIGLMQIFSFLIFAWIVYDSFSKKAFEKYRIILLLLLSPAFLFELLTRSELFSNMIFVLLYLHLYMKYYDSSNRKTQIILGLLGGFLLSTRGIVLLIYILFFGYYAKNKTAGLLTVFISMSVGFILTLIPFALWNFDYFFDSGPFAVQLLYIPIRTLILILVALAVVLWQLKSEHMIFPALAIALTVVIFISMMSYVADFGWPHAILTSKFDISYFCFALPFILISLARPVGRPK